MYSIISGFIVIPGPSICGFTGVRPDNFFLDGDQQPPCGMGKMRLGTVPAGVHGEGDENEWSRMSWTGISVQIVEPAVPRSRASPAVRASAKKANHPGRLVKLGSRSHLTTAQCRQSRTSSCLKLEAPSFVSLCPFPRVHGV